LLLAVIPALAAPLFAIADATPEEIEQNRKKLAKYKADPKAYARLRRELGPFRALAPAEQERLRRLDRELHLLDPAVLARLSATLERYADWLERLPPEELRQVKAVPDKEKRLEVVRGIYERQWVARLPAAVRTRLANAPEPERKRLLDQLRRRHRQQRREWARAFKRWDELLRRPPLRYQDLEQDEQMFVKEFLRPRLDEREKRHLDFTANRGRVFPVLLVDLADHHPMALPGSKGPTKFEELPKPVRDRLPERAKGSAELKQAEGNWPDYGKQVARVARENNVPLPFEFLPERIEDLSWPVKRFVRRKLMPMLTPAERRRLRKTLSWPEFPQLLDKLAREHKMRVPWLTLPGRPERWDVYRDRPIAPRPHLPRVPRQTLRSFALLELTPRERVELGLAHPNLKTWERLKKLYFQRKPHKLRYWREAEARAKKKKQQARKGTGN
jgi:hypothetical protein